MCINLLLKISFFKNFDNNDFIVKVIFCFQPILAIKNDILIKDGDFIEDIIFVKKGKLTLELSIKIKEEEENINSNKSNSKKNQLNSDINNFTQALMTIYNNHLKNQSPKCINNSCEEGTFQEEEQIKYQNYKILDIRKNEHFGEVLMLSNERNPLIAIVKSRKAKLFYLNKKDAIDISNDYPQIWSRIEQKSIFNMKQIKKKIDKNIENFYNSNGNKGELSNFKTSKTNESDLQSIPSILDYNRNNTSGLKYKEINNLKTIKETTIIEDSESKSKSSISNSSSTTNKNNKSDSIDNDQTKQYEIKTDSSNYDYYNNNNILSIDTIKIKNDNNIMNVDFSEIYSDKDTYNKYFNSKRSLLTPYKPDEINKEIYPNENFTNNENYNKINYTNINNFNDCSNNNSQKSNILNKKMISKNNLNNDYNINNNQSVQQKYHFQ